MASRDDYRGFRRQAGAATRFDLPRLMRDVTEADNPAAASSAAADILDRLGFAGFAIGSVGLEDEALRGAFMLGEGPVAQAAESYAKRGLSAQDPHFRRFFETWRMMDLTALLRTDMPTPPAENLLAHGVRTAALLPLMAGPGPVRLAAAVAGRASEDPDAFGQRLRDHGWLAKLALVALADRAGDLARCDGGGLTTAERAVLRAVARGQRPKEIAIALGKSEKTVRNQIETARLRLDARTNAHAVAEAIRRGFILP